jgi:hypothetical protein
VFIVVFLLQFLFVVVLRTKINVQTEQILEIIILPENNILGKRVGKSVVDLYYKSSF